MVRIFKRFLFLFTIACIFTAPVAFYVLDWKSIIGIQTNPVLESAKSGNPQSMFWIGNYFYYGHSGTKVNREEGVKWWEKAAEKNHAESFNSLGLKYKKGEYFPQDIKQAFTYIQKACHLGSMHGCYNLAGMYKNGLGTEKDTSKAFNLLKTAAAHNHGQSQYMLAIFYAYGVAGPQDKVEAYAWFYTFNNKMKKDAPSQNVFNSDLYNKSVNELNKVISSMTDDEQISANAKAAEYSKKYLSAYP